MKRKIIALLFLLMGCTFLNAAPYSEKIKELLVRLDSLIAQKNTFAMLKEAKIAQLHKLRKDVRTLEERYFDRSKRQNSIYRPPSIADNPIRPIGR